MGAGSGYRAKRTLKSESGPILKVAQHAGIARRHRSAPSGAISAGAHLRMLAKFGSGLPQVIWQTGYLADWVFGRLAILGVCGSH